MPRVELLSRPRFSDALVRAAVFGQALGGFMLSMDRPAFRFQDSTGQTPGVGTSSETVGLLLDQWRGIQRGAEQRAAGFTFAVGTGASATYNPATGAATLARVDLANQAGVRFSGLTASSVYVVTGTITAGGIAIRSGDQTAAAAQFAATGPFSATLPPGSGLISITAPAGSNTSGTVTGLSVIEIPGTHFGQSTSTSRPLILADAQGLPYMQFDGADDFLLSAADADYTAADTVTTFACVQLSASVGSMLAEHSSSSPSLPGGWTLYIDGPNSNLASRLTGASQNNSVSATGTAPTGVKLIAMMEGSFAAPAHTLVGSQLGSTNTPLAEAYRKLAKAPIYLGARGGTSLLLQGRLYSLLQVATLGTLTASQKAIASRWVGMKGGL